MIKSQHKRFEWLVGAPRERHSLWLDKKYPSPEAVAIAAPEGTTAVFHKDGFGTVWGGFIPKLK